MWTTAHIRRRLAQMTSTKPFSIREFLAFGARAAVDQAFARLLKNGEVIRVARGLYIKGNAPLPSLIEVAQAKAAAFNRTIALHGSQAVVRLKISGEANPSQTRHEHVFATSGRTSSFRFGNQIIRFIGTSPRKLHLADSKVGLAIRALWYLGKKACTIELASCATRSFLRPDREDLKKNAAAMPAWMLALFPSITRFWLGPERLPNKPAWLKAREQELCLELLR